ncbi:MAG TPA: response regulator transcription factor [Thermoleophilaceae bacterium]
MALKVLLADDHRLTLAGVRRVLDESGDIVVVGEAYSGEDVLPLVRSTGPDLVVLDLQMPKMDGLSCLNLIRRHHPDVKVVIFSATTAVPEISTAFQSGASAYVLKTVNPLDLPAVIRQAAEGTVFYPPPAVAAPAAKDTNDLTERERTILLAVMRGLSNKAISQEFWVTEQTVKFHLSNVYRKLGVPNRTAAARFAQEHGLIDANELQIADSA